MLFALVTLSIFYQTVAGVRINDRVGLPPELQKLCFFLKILNAVKTFVYGVIKWLYRIKTIPASLILSEIEVSAVFIEIIQPL